MRKSAYSSLKRQSSNRNSQIFLPPDEYAMVMSEFNTHMSEEERTHKIVVKAIGGSVYTVINNGFNDYVVIGKHGIDEEYGVDWENENE